jgi:threonylcarbamoyladenosine tRNA methylthiotransferase MtaB
MELQKRAALVTFGCKVNQYESAFMGEGLAQQGWRLVSNKDEPDLVVVNTCTVTAQADRQVRQCLRRLGRIYPAAALLVTGCYAQRAPQEVAALPGVQWVLGNSEKSRLEQFLTSMPRPQEVITCTGAISQAHNFAPMPLVNFPEHTRAFVKIQDGCNNRCTYCIVPQVRGPARSLPLIEVLRQIQSLTEQGFQEIVLTGIHLGQYGLDLPNQEGLLGLIKELRLQQLPCRFRLSSLEPQEISPVLLEELADWPQFCPHFHIPLQSGSSAILRAMQRPYEAAWFRALIGQIHSLWPRAALGVDVMVGFPGEGEKEFAQTRHLLEDLPLSYLHVFVYSPRPGTPAALLPHESSNGVAQFRSHWLRKLSHTKKADFYRRQLGQEEEVLLEGLDKGKPGWLQGLSPNYVRVLVELPSDWAGRTIRTRLVRLRGEYVLGVPV